MYGLVFYRVYAGFNTNVSRVSHLSSPNRHDLYRHQSAALPLHPSVHNLQEPDYYSYCIRGGVVVWRIHLVHDPLFLWPDGAELGGCGLG